MDTITLSSYFLAAYFLFVALFYTVRLKTQPKPRQFLGAVGSQHWLGHVVFRLFRTMILLICILRLFFESIDTALFIIDPLYIAPVIATGCILMIAGFSFSLLGHFTLGDNWTSGLNPSGPKNIVACGVYRRSRNPIFCGVLISQFGFFLALPSVFTLICFLIGVAAVLNQTKLEERYLIKNFGQMYLDYCKAVPRWFGLSSLKPAIS